MDSDCSICLGIGFVCENHPDKAWSEESGCQCGAGMPCQCVRAAGLTYSVQIHPQWNQNADHDDSDEEPAHHFSLRTPLNFLALFLTAMNCPPALLRLVDVLVSGFLSWVRFYTAPLRALSPVGLLIAICASKEHQFPSHS